MCIVIDPPALIPMFKTADVEHQKFSPVRKWIVEGPGKIIIGGAQYRKELLDVISIIQFVKELERRGKVIRKCDAEVDRDVERIKRIEPCKDFDDPHLVALINLSGCKLICIRDPRAHRFLRNKKFYNNTKLRPRLYTRAKNSNLLCKDNIAPCCK